MAAYNLVHADNSKPDIVVQPLMVDTSTDLTFVGRGVPDYGEAEHTNFLRLLENFASDSQPVKPIEGQIWYKPSDSQLYTCIQESPAQWVSISQMAINTTQPTSPEVGQLWYDIPNSKLKVYTGSIWMAVGINSTYISATAPISPNGPFQGQFWYDLANTTLKLYNSGIWISITSSTVTVTSGSTAPVGSALGQLWFDTTDMALKIWTGLSWDVSHRSVAIVSGTTPSNPQLGLLWYDSAAFTLKIFDGTTFMPAIPVQDEGIKWLGLLAM
jgi:hypothetical protein